MEYAANATRDQGTATGSRHQPARVAGTIRVLALGWSLSLSFAISFILCVLGYLLLPSLPVLHGALAIPLPGFQLGSWPRFFLGLAESFAWGWYIALLFGALYNYFAARVR